jgi:transcriptional regulator with XRE-family HTH domain
MTKVKELALSPQEGSSTDKSVRADGRVRPNSEEIKRLRRLRGLSQQGLADRSGISFKTVRNLETTEDYRCNPDSLQAIAACFDVKAHTLIVPEAPQSVRLITSSRELIAANMRLVTTSKAFLACIGSRSRDPEYMQLIEKTLKDNPRLVHYRTMVHPPFKKEFQDHLLNLLKIRNPQCRMQGKKTLYIGIYDSYYKQSEASIVANETGALIVLPSMWGIGEYNTALLIEDPMIGDRYVNIVKNLYQLGRTLETKEDILNLGIVKKGETYV